MDWKEALGGLMQDGGLPEGEPSGAPQSDNAESKERKSADRLHVSKERKGRNGKTATIVYGFSCDDAELKEIAGALKKRLGTGGSARGGEILIQGDVADKVRAVLREMGWNIN